jgi:hypothetical protein
MRLLERLRKFSTNISLPAPVEPATRLADVFLKKNALLAHRNECGAPQVALGSATAPLCASGFFSSYADAHHKQHRIEDTNSQLWLVLGYRRNQSEMLIH